MKPRRQSSLFLTVFAIGAAVDAVRCQQAAGQETGFRVVSIATGGNPVWPYRIRALGRDGKPTGELLEVRSPRVLEEHATDRNPVLPPARFPARAVLPGGGIGNQYLLFRFNEAVDADSVLRSNALRVLAYDPRTEETRVVPGRWFAGGFALDVENGNRIVRAVAEKGDGLAVLHPQGDGFPSGFRGDGLLARPRSVVFVADSDGKLGTPDAFPPGVLIRIVVTGGVRSADGGRLENELCVATTRSERSGRDPGRRDP